MELNVFAETNISTIDTRDIFYFNRNIIYLISLTVFSTNILDSFSIYTNLITPLHRSYLNWLPIYQRRYIRPLTNIYSLLFSPNSSPCGTTQLFRFSNNVLIPYSTLHFDYVHSLPWFNLLCVLFPLLCHLSVFLL